MALQVFQSVGAPPAKAFYLPASPATTVSTVPVMMGLGIGYTTVSGTGKLEVHITGMAASLTAAAMVTLSGRYGTGGAPANGVAVTGTQFPTLALTLKANGVGSGSFFDLVGLLTGLTPGTTYWFDASYDTSVVADAASISNLGCTIQECS